MSEENTLAPKGTSPARKRYWAVWIVAVCLFGGGSYLFSQMSTSQPRGAKGKGKGGGGAVPVSVASVQHGNIGVYINALGTVTPVYTVTLTSRVTGQLMDVRYREGQIVKKGDLLAVIDPRPYVASLTQAQGQLERDQALLKNSKIDLDRYKVAYEQHAIPQQTLATQEATVSQNEGTVKVDQGTLDAAQVNVDYTQITSPIDGRIGLRLVDPGNIVTANGTTGLLTITQIQPITVIFTMAEDYLSDVVPQMQSGHPLRVDAFDRSQSTKIAQGTVLTIDNQIDTTTGTVRVRATFQNSDNRLFPNEFVNARLLVKTLRNVNLIPTSAIQRNNDISYVYIVNPNRTVKSRNITVAATDGNTTAVSGVNPGETVVSDGFDRLQDGTRVSIRTPNDGSSQSPGASAATPENQPENPEGSSDQQNTGKKKHRQAQSNPQ
jgi:membrane fusion protein, multidrug efflux system